MRRQGFIASRPYRRAVVKAGEALQPDALTVNERVLLHLRESGVARDTVDAYPLTQPGIAETLGIRVNHVSRAVKQLIRQRLVTEGTARIRGEVRRRKVYAVTPEGHALAQRLMGEVSQRLVVAVDAEGERSMTAADARHRVSPPTLTRLLTAIDAEGRLDLRKPHTPATREPVRFEEGRPAPRALAGRDDELAVVSAWLRDGPPILAVIGPHGIGKSALASAGIGDDLPEFWWSLRGGDTPASFLHGLAAWLAALGKGDLRARLAKEPPDSREVGKVVGRDLRGTNAVLVLDDAHVACRELAPYLDAIVESAAGAGCRVAVTAEAPLPRRKGLLADGLLRELPLEGLDRTAARAVLPDADAKEFEKAYRLTKGNPLSLKLVGAEKTFGEFTPEERALLKVLKMRQDED